MRKAALLAMILSPTAAADTFIVMTAYNEEGIESRYSEEVSRPMQCGEISLSWTAPTQNEDGSPLTDLAGYKIYYGQASGQYDASEDLNSPGLTSYVLNVPCLRVEAPLGLTVVDANLYVFMLNQTKNNPVLEPVGTIPAGTPCNGSKSINGNYYVVDVDLVDWAGSVRPQVVWAQCQPGL